MLSRLRLDGLAQRIALLILCHAVILCGLLLAMLNAGDDLRSPIYRFAEPVEVAAIANAFERTPPANHPDLVRAFTNELQQVAILRRWPSVDLSSVAPDMQPGLDKTAAKFRTALEGRPFRIQMAGGEFRVNFDRERRLLSHKPVRVLILLKTGEILAVRRVTFPVVARVIAYAPRLAVAIAIVDILLILWLAALTTRPVDRLLTAVRADKMEGLAIAGPRELVELGSAFSALRARLHGLIEERTRILAAIAHDFRTYLTRLQLRADYIDDAQQRALAEEDLREMNMLLSDTLTFAGQSAEGYGDPEDTDMRVELETAIADRRQLGQSVQLGPLPLKLRARVARISCRRMLANLIDNAVRYGDRAYVHVECVDGSIVVTVEDDGPGVPEEHLAELTEPFLRLESSRARHTGGAGLGLSIVQALAHRHGGALVLGNRPEGGFRARLTLSAVGVT